MTTNEGGSLATRPSLLRRLKAGDDPQSWLEFYRTYGGLIRFFAQKAGLTADETEEVVQETAIGVARGLPQFTYDPKVCRFKTWLLNLTRWRIQNQLRRRKALRRGDEFDQSGAYRHIQDPGSSMGNEASAIERIPDPAIPEFGAEWEAAWQKNLLTQALEHLRARLDERQFQVFDLYVTKGWPPADVAQLLGASVAWVYLTKNRVLARLKKEVRRLERLEKRSHEDRI
jgi:RNA polymerase sigma-70 factor (ECF subfamily)